MEIYIKKSDIHTYRFEFDGSIGLLSDFIEMAKINGLDKNKAIEVLPSIYCHEIESNSRLKRLVFGTQKYKIINKNCRNSFRIFKPSSGNSEKSYKYAQIDTNENTISLSSVEYPDMLSSCPIIQLFSDKNLLEANCSNSIKELYINPSTSYTLFSVNDVLAMTANDVKLRNMCKKSNKCGRIIKSIESFGFRDENSIDPIIIQQYGRTMVPFEGKHRICVAKILGIEAIRANITSITFKTCASVNSPSRICIVDQTWFEKLWKNYHSLFNNLQIDSALANRIVEESDLSIVYNMIRPYILLN